MTDQEEEIARERTAVEGSTGSQRVRWALVLILGSVLTAANAIWMSYMEIMWNQGYATLLSLAYNAVFTLIVLVACNTLVRGTRLRGLTQTELLLLFVMVSLGTVIASLTEYLMAVLPYPVHFAHLDPAYQATLIPRLPRLLMVTDAAAARDYYTGNAALCRWDALRSWALPFAAWGLFISALVWTGYCLSTLVYNQLRHQERMPFPLVQIPTLITDPGARSFRSKLFWTAFAIAGGINILNALAMVYPSLPTIPVKRQHLQLSGMARPWSAISPLMFSLNPLLIGLGFFLPLDMLFSLFFFYWAGRLEGVFLAFLGSEVNWPVDSMVAPYVREQSTGALFTLILYSFWISRRGWRESWERYPMSLSAQRAARGAVLGTGVMAGVLVAGGMPIWLALLLPGVYLLFSLSMARIRAHYGPPSVGLMLGAPGPVLYAVMGRDGLGSGGLTHLAVTHWLGREMGNAPLPTTLESFALLERRRATRLAWCLVVAAVAAYTATFGTALVSGYAFGHSTARTAGTQVYFGNEAFALFSKRLGDPVSGPHPDSLLAMGLGAGVTLGLQALRARFAGFPLHPVGYAVASSYIATFVWSTAILVWAFKWMLLRYAGLRGYYRIAPFFLGLLLGEFVVGSLISLIGVVSGQPVYVFWPY
jgi:hypothetical protein